MTQDDRTRDERIDWVIEGLWANNRNLSWYVIEGTPAEQRDYNVDVSRQSELIEEVARLLREPATPNPKER